jgi:hypothetical protein
MSTRREADQGPHGKTSYRWVKNRYVQAYMEALVLEAEKDAVPSQPPMTRAEAGRSWTCRS